MILVVSAMSNDVATLPDDPVVLKAMIAALQALRLRTAKLQKQAFGASSEKIEHEIEQLELAQEDLLVAVAEATTTPHDEDGAQPSSEKGQNKPRRRPRVSDDTPRERRELDPGHDCPDCGGDLRIVGEDVSELLDMIAPQLKVIEIVGIKKPCRRCEKMALAPSRPIPGSMAGPSLLAYVLVSKFDDHLPLYGLNEIFARMGADIPDCTLVGWCVRAMKALQPLTDRIEAEIMASDLLHCDGTPIRVLDRSRRDKGLGKGVKQGRIWAYVRDQRPWAGTAPPGAVYYFAPTGRVNMSDSTCRTAAAPCKRTPTLASTNSMKRGWMAAASSARLLAARICVATSITSGLRTNRRSPVRPSTGEMVLLFRVGLRLC
ncbi:MAG: transposase [Paracoccaceae bacterium]